MDNSRKGTHNLLDTTLKRSAETSLKVHEKDIYDAEEGLGSNGWHNLYAKWNRALNNQQFAVFKAIHAWRDQTARDEDESHRYVLPNHMMFTLAEKMPEEAAGVLGCCNPVPPAVRMNATDIAMLISRTKSSVAPVAGGFKKVEIKVAAHVRFDPETGLQPTEHALNEAEKKASIGLSPLEKAQQSTRGKVQAAASSGVFGRSSVAAVVKPLADPTPLLAMSSGLFGTSGAIHTSRAEEDARDTARRIMHELSIEPVEEAPVFMEVSSVSAAPVAAVESKPATEEEVVFTPADDRVTKQKRTDVLVLNTMSKKRSRALDEDRAELSEAATEATSEVEEVTPIKKKKSKKEKGINSTASSKPSSDAEMPEAFQPFDYNSVRSVVDETVDGAMSNKRKQKKKKAGPAENEPPARMLTFPKSKMNRFARICFCFS